jgi:hypothetical protein
MKAMWVVVATTLVAPAAFAQDAPATTWNGLPDRFQVDTGYFRLSSDTVLRFEGPAGGSGEVDFERDLGVDETANTFWVDGTWRVGRRHQLKLAVTRVSRERPGFTLERDFTWGGEVYSAGLTSTADTSSTLLGGYYRFALVRNDRFEIGPAVGIGYLWVDARISATGTVSGPDGPQNRTRDRSASTGSITGALGGYAAAWPAKRLKLEADFLYIKINPEDAEASVKDWRVAANFYFTRHVGIGAQYKYYRYSYDRGLESAELGGALEYEGGQLYLSFLF